MKEIDELNRNLEGINHVLRDIRSILLHGLIEDKEFMVEHR